jgi:hypothetical protein
MARARPETTGRKPINANAGGAKPPSRGPPQLLAFSIKQFCELHGISLDFYFKLQRRGLGPKVMRVGARTLISQESAAEWRRACEQGAPPTTPGETPEPNAPPGRGRPRQDRPPAEKPARSL